MSRARRQRDSTAPSLFPFLAVLLCTMGALVLLLMLIVSGAQASALKIAQQSQEQAEEVESQLRLASHGFQKQLTEGRLELEKKRLSLQHLENHIQELLAELQDLERTAELMLNDAASSDETRKAQVDAISDLEKQLLEAEEQLKQKLDKPDGDKPIFAIIPYAGPNGTHRRPIYLECVEDGIKIQPEGIALSLVDLEPPYGPGNPLDAALRTIRTQFAPANHAITSTAYPLLIVRPSGIRTYAMARAAMSGWDDQFGYELVGEDLELTYPEIEPGLSDKIAQALDLARQRQAALIMAMPQKYRQFSEREQSLSGGQTGGMYPAADGSMVDANGHDDGTGRGGASRDSQRGGWANQAGLYAGGQASNSDSSLGFGEAGTASQLDFQAAQQEVNARSGSSASGSSTLGSEAGSSEGSYFPTNSLGSAAGDLAASGNASSDSSSRNSGASSSSGSNGPSTPSDQLGTGGPNASGQPAQSSGGSQIGLPFSPQSGANNSSSGTSLTQGSSQPNGSSAQSASSLDSSSDSSQITSPSMSVDLSPSNLRKPSENSTPVAARRGRGWAWSQGPASQTPVARAINLQCFADRWVVLPDSGKSNSQIVTVPLDSAPQQHAEKLANIIADRVDSWGLALTGGYWKPILVVEVAPDAAWRFNQLQQLFDHSGLEVQRAQ